MRHFGDLAIAGIALVVSGRVITEDMSDVDASRRVEPSAEAILRLERTPAGLLAACDASGACTEQPNPDDCAELEIAIDPSSGATCSRCLDARGTAVAGDCAHAPVACTVVTAPDPHCLVCAWVDGAVVYSTCVPRPPA